MTAAQEPPDLPPQLALSALHDRIVGTLFGAALGDAIGLYTEFLTPEKVSCAYPSGRFTLHPPSSATPFRRDHHRSPHLPGNWTGDTDHSLLILLSFLHNEGELSPADFAARLSVWVRNGLRALDTLPFGLGRTVGLVVRNPSFLEDPEGRAREVWVTGGREIAPNGSLMRTHPLGVMCLSQTRAGTFETAARFSVVTHVDPRCVVSCAIGTELARGLARGEYTLESHVDAVVEAALEWYTAWAAARTDAASGEPDPPLAKDELYRHVRASNFKELDLASSAMGYVYKCLGSGILVLRLAIRAVTSSPTPLATQVNLFEELITSLVLEGGDGDTNACFAGALLGAYLGYKALPPHWRDGLRHGDWLMHKAEGLSRVVGASPGTYSGKEDADTALDGGRGLLTDAQMEQRFMVLQARIAQEEQEHNRKLREDEKMNRASCLVLSGSDPESPEIPPTGPRKQHKEALLSSNRIRFISPTRPAHICNARQLSLLAKTRVALDRLPLLRPRRGNGIQQPLGIPLRLELLQVVVDVPPEGRLPVLLVRIALHLLVPSP